MRRIKLLGVVLLGLCVLHADISAKAQDQRDDRGQRDGGRRGPRGGFGFGGPGFGGGFGRGAFGGGGGLALLGLLRIDEVRQELKVSEDQEELVQVLAEEINEGRPAFPANFREMTDAEREAFQKEMQAWAAKQTKEAKATLQTILSADQYKRLNEIYVQTQGTAALSDEDIAAKLQLTAEQKSKIAAALEENQQKLREEMQAAFGGRGQRGRPDGERPQGRGPEGRFDFSAMRERMEQFRKEADERVLSVLTEEQKKAFEELKGAAFTMPELRGGFGGGRGGFRGGQGRPDRPQRPE